MKKILVGLVLVLTFLSFGLASDEVSASKLGNRVVNLTEGQTSNSTSRITTSIGNVIRFSGSNSGKYNISYRIFENGVAITGYQTVRPGVVENLYTRTVKKNAEYSMRLYCNSSSGTGCRGMGVLQNH